jgi:2-polyprenyl-6-methoxyphenol hydroxylase-like FAD-dependent oxidoreductase
MAGLLAARILADCFDSVTIIERDALPDHPVSRPGVPQARHLHALLMRGLQIIERLLPGLHDALLAAGAEALDVGLDLAWLTPDGWGVRFRSGLSFLAFSRSLLDWSVRQRLAAFSNIYFLQGCDVTGLVANADGSQVDGIKLRPRNQTIELAPNRDWRQADFVVDASGRHSQTPAWLEAIDCEPPRETVVDAHLGYASRIYRRPCELQADWKAQFQQAAPPRRIRAGIIFPIEGNRWLLTLGGGDRDYPPTDEKGFLDFARSLSSTLIYEAIKDAEPLSAIHGFRNTENRLRHYDRLRRWPERFVVIGDAVCAFNPVYGQGMTTSALGALTLEQCLREQARRRQVGDLTGLARTFHAKLAKVNLAPWMLATSEDYRYLGTEGRSTDRATRIMHGYVDQVMRLSTRSVPVRRTFLRVQQMLDSPGALFRPSVLVRVLWRVLGQALKGGGMGRRNAAGERAEAPFGEPARTPSLLRPNDRPGQARFCS